MRENIIEFRPIGIIHSPNLDASKVPIQPVFASEIAAEVEVFPEFSAGLADLEGFSHIFLIYHFHKADAAKLRVKPYLQAIEHGVFATHAPSRPNAIGLSIVRLVRRTKNILTVAGADILDGTPLIDIKPYIKRFDRIDTERDGWQDGIDDKTAVLKGSRRKEN